VLPTDNWYAVHAAARLEAKYSPTLQPLGVDGAGVTVLAGEAAFVRVRELRLAEMPTEAGVEWRAAYDSLPPARQVQAVGLAARWGWHLQAIASAARLGVYNDYDLLYPRPFDYDVRAAAKRTGLDPELIYAIIRQESLYEPTAGSSAGALGLMQLLPGTARIVARRVGLANPDTRPVTRASDEHPAGFVVPGGPARAIRR
jgi:soluble lytic murein transglycosylase